ncbi:hypothetical protein Dimus_032046 [Dionaea muscipula]
MLPHVKLLLLHCPVQDVNHTSSSFSMKPTGSYQVLEAAPPHFLIQQEAGTSHLLSCQPLPSSPYKLQLLSKEFIEQELPPFEDTKLYVLIHLLPMKSLINV